MKAYLYILFLFLIHKALVAQYPQCFTYNDENGLPSNEVYSIIQDKKGFIWLGCDAGLFKYDGVKYIPYKCEKQNSKSISGLTISSSGKLYCHNFQSQIFMMYQDTLVEICNLFPSKITSITSGKNNNIYVHHSGGINIYNELNKKWTNYGTADNEYAVTTNSFTTKGSLNHPKDTLLFIELNGISGFTNKKISLYKTDFFKNQSPGAFLLEYHNKTFWIFSSENNLIYTFKNKKLQIVKNKHLQAILSNRKITNVRALSDGKLWICTYKGIIRFDTYSEKFELYYPEKSFSDCIIDRENNFWFSTLQNGLLRAPNLEMLVWNRDNESLMNEKISKITCGDSSIYFATINGTIGKLNSKTYVLKTFHTGNHGDIQSFDYDLGSQTLNFYTNNNLFSLKNNTLTQQDTGIKAIKTTKQIGNDIFTGSSHGLFVNKKTIKHRWTREIEYDKSNNTVWVASNDGLMKIVWQNNEWNVKNILLEGEQILSINFNEDNKLVYALTFNGKIHSINQQNVSNFVAEIPDKTQAIKIKVDKDIIYTATNKGLWKYYIKKKAWEVLTKLSGLASDNIQSLAIANESVWLATGKGVQKIPLHEAQNKKTAIVYLKKIVAGITYTNTINPKKLSLNYGQPLLLYPEASTYNSNGNFQYAYRIKTTDTSWVNLPSSIEQIEIQNIPSGEFEIELKVINHLGLNSENTISLKGTVKPPFWKSLWFITIIILLTGSFIYLLFIIRIHKMQQSQRKEIERINLENELRLSRETALKSQMNPHFIFNVLNSIKAYIYKNDKQKATEYLNEFSALIRTFLNMSNSPSISLNDELKMMKLYINMEGMLLKEDFTYQQNIDENIDLTQTDIPSLIVQPFVENAFKHGLHHKKGNKHLILNIFGKEENKIVIEIIDNGIGRTASREINNTEKTIHQSFATTAIEKRIELLNKDRKLVDVKIIDLYEKETSIGTKVIIEIDTNG